MGFIHTTTLKTDDSLTISIPLCNGPRLQSAPSDDKVPLDIAVLFVAEDGAIVKDKSILDRVSKSSDGVRYAARLVDAPCSEMNTTALVEEALEQVKVRYFPASFVMPFTRDQKACRTFCVLG